MSVLVPSATRNHHYVSMRQLNGSSVVSRKIVPVINRSALALNGLTDSDMNADRVPLGMVNSMKQRLLDKFNESLLLIHPGALTRHSPLKASNENLLQPKSSLKHTARLSRSHENLLNHQSESLNTYLQAKPNVVIIEASLKDEALPVHRYLHLELPIDEVPKPGTVITVKNMFERQIRMSRSDTERTLHPSSSSGSRINLLSPTRSRSISPNDMAFRQRRATVSGLTSTSNGSPLSVPSTYPDLVISHTPTASSQRDIKETTVDSSTSNLPNDENKRDDHLSSLHMNGDLRDHNSSPTPTTTSDTVHYESLDFKSRLALFNRSEPIERTVEQSPSLNIIKKPSSTPQATQSPPNFLTKPVLHHSSEKTKIPTENLSNSATRILAVPPRGITFFGGARLEDNVQLPRVAPTILPLSPKTSEVSIDSFQTPDVIGGHVKLAKSSIFSGIKKDGRVQFLEYVDTFEYLSCDAALAEWESNNDYIEREDDGNSSNHAVDQDGNDDDPDDELGRLAKINANLNAKNLSEPAAQSKGSLHTFRPTYLDAYALGSQHASHTTSSASDTSSFLSGGHSFSTVTAHPALFQQGASPFDLPNHIQWSSLTANTDLLF